MKEENIRSKPDMNSGPFESLRNALPLEPPIQQSNGYYFLASIRLHQMKTQREM